MIKLHQNSRNCRSHVRKSKHCTRYVDILNYQVQSRFRYALQRLIDVTLSFKLKLVLLYFVVMIMGLFYFDVLMSIRPLT